MKIVFFDEKYLPTPYDHSYVRMIKLQLETKLINSKNEDLMLN